MNLIIGPPGTGKTTTILKQIEALLAEGVPANKIGLISFTKKAAEEAVTRACDKFNLPAAAFPYFRTIHSLCFRQMGITTSQMMKRQHYKELGDALGVDLGHYMPEDGDLETLPKGDRLLFVEGLARLRCIPLQQQWEELNEDILWEELDQLSRALKSYKSAHGLIDFTDLLHNFVAEGITPSLHTLFVDEAQDLSQAQWRVVDKLSTTVDNLVIAGDDDQAIFRWAGADVNHFLALPGKALVLGLSYRLTSPIHQVSMEISGKISNRRPKIFEPGRPGGSVTRHFSVEELDLSQGEWLVLARHGYQLRALEQLCLREGLDYDLRGRGPRSWESLKAARTWEQLRAGGTLPSDDVKDMCYYLAPKVLQPKAIPPGTYFDMPGLKALGLVEDRIWHEALVRIPVEEREYLINALRGKENFKGPARIILSTIHGAKGGERTNVALLTDMSSKAYASYLENPDDETRVFYVGATRAIENLHVVEPQTDKGFII